MCPFRCFLNFSHSAVVDDVFLNSWLLSKEINVNFTIIDSFRHNFMGSAARTTLQKMNIFRTWETSSFSLVLKSSTDMVLKGRSKNASASILA